MEPRRVIRSFAVAVAVAVAAAVAAAAAAAVLVGCGGSDTPVASGGTPASSSSSSAGKITMKDFAFTPRTLTVRGGGRVGVSNDDSTAHTVTADDGHSFDTGAVGAGASKSLTAPKAGRYPYHCSIHSFMHGTLVVH
jgi:plastocyanin